MGRFQRVCAILDEAVGGPDAPVGFHGPFWRGRTREQFLATQVFGRALVVPGDVAASDLVRALRGRSPFGADVQPPSPDAAFNRMPSGRPAVPEESIALIEHWIDDGCPEDDPAPVEPTWQVTNAPTASSRTDDICFRDPLRGWAVNSNGQILHTEDGFATWEEQLRDPTVYFRCIGFASDTRGWVGTLTPGKRLFETHDGGVTWTAVPDLPALAPSAVCGLSVVDQSVVYASGTNYPNRPARMMRTVDGGATWAAWDMSGHAALLVDTHFTDADHGWVVGGQATVPNPTRDDVRAVVLRTEDGGRTWVDRLAPLAAELPLGEWGWKIHFVDAMLGYVALESFVRGAILKTTDGGASWSRIDITDPQGNANLEGVGFVDEMTGWVGGWGSDTFLEGSSSATTDGGKTWRDANEIGRFINRFRFFGSPVTDGYAAGLTVYRYSTEPAARIPTIAPAAPLRLLQDNAPIRAERPLRLPITVPEGARFVRVDVWDRFGEHVGTLLDEPDPVPGSRTVEWDVTDESGSPLSGSLLVRVSDAATSESRIVHVPR
jgi:photosystem II stability/assembly factor-like uncharacterized protein